MDYQYSYSYRIALCLANAQSRIKLTDKRDVIDKAIGSYNASGFRMQNPKKISEYEVTENLINLTLYSAVELETPGRALKSLSRILLKDLADEDFEKAIAANGQLFRTVQLPGSKTEKRKSTVEWTELSDVDFLKKLMDYVYGSDKKVTKKKEEQQKEAMRQIKRIAVESEIIG